MGAQSNRNVGMKELPEKGRWVPGTVVQAGGEAADPDSAPDLLAVWLRASYLTLCFSSWDVLPSLGLRTCCSLHMKHSSPGSPD